MKLKEFMNLCGVNFMNNYICGECGRELVPSVQNPGAYKCLCWKTKDSDLPSMKEIIAFMSARLKQKEVFH